jgi:hypothetical protein
VLAGILGVGDLETDEERKPRPRLEGEPGAPFAFFGFAVRDAKSPVIDEKEEAKTRVHTSTANPEHPNFKTWDTCAGEGEYFEVDMGLLTIVVITSIMWSV